MYNEGFSMTAIFSGECKLNFSKGPLRQTRTALLYVSKFFWTACSENKILSHEQSLLSGYYLSAIEPLSSPVIIKCDSLIRVDI